MQAWAFLDPERALAQARAADTTRRSGKGVGPLHGVPVGIKDIIDTADMPTENGSAFYKGRQPDADAACVTALRRAGAVILGKTVTTELATFTPGKTRNPHNLEHTPGGSSSGSAAAVGCRHGAAGARHADRGLGHPPGRLLRRLWLQADLRGRSRAPGVLTQAPSLDTVGVFGRSIEDVALIADALQGHDDRDPASLAGEPRPPARDRHARTGRCRRCSPSSRRMPGAMPTRRRTRPSASSSSSSATR